MVEFRKVIQCLYADMHVCGPTRNLLGVGQTMGMQMVGKVNFVDIDGVSCL